MNFDWAANIWPPKVSEKKAFKVSVGKDLKEKMWEIIENNEKNREKKE